MARSTQHVSPPHRTIDDSLQEREHLFRMVAENSTDAIGLHSEDGRLLWGSDSFERHLGYTLDELYAMPPLAYVHPDDLPFVRAELKRVFNGETVKQMEYRKVTKSGEVIWVLTDGLPITDESGKVVKALTSCRNISKRKQMELALAESEAQFKTAFEESLIGMALVSVGGGFIKVNNSLCQITGYSEDELLKINFQQITLPEDLEIDLDLFNQTMRGEINGYTLEKRYIHKDGHIIWVRLGTSLIRDANGEALHFISQIEDVTDRKEAEKALYDKSIHMELALDSADLGTWEWDLATGYVHYNDRYITMLGYTVDEWEHSFTQWDSLLHPDERGWINETLQKHLRGETPVYQWEYRLRCKDGSWKWILDRGCAYRRDAEGKPLRVIGVHMDINERKLLEIALHQQHEHMNLALEAAELGTWNWDFVRDVIDVDDRYVAMLGYSREEMRDYTRWVEILHPDDRDAVIKTLNAHINGEIPQYQAEYRILRKDGIWRWMLDRGRVVERDINGKPLRVIGIQMDIQQRKQRDEETLELAVEKERIGVLNRFIQNAAHEFRTPLSIIQSSTYLMTRMNDPEQRGTKATQINEQIEHLTELVDMLALQTMLDSGAPMEYREVDINTLINELSRQFQREITKHKLSIRLDLAEELPHIQVDRDRIAEALREIVDNAVRYTQENGLITISTRHTDAGIMISVADTGQGIDPEVLPHIFERFYRADEAHSTRGSGLGLSIAATIVEQHHGTIDVETRVGKGSTFIIRLPLKPT